VFELNMLPCSIRSRRGGGPTPVRRLSRHAAAPIRPRASRAVEKLALLVPIAYWQTPEGIPSGPMNSQNSANRRSRCTKADDWAEAESLYFAGAGRAARRTSFTARHLLGRIGGSQSGRMDEALADIGAALALNPDDPEALLNHANVLKSLNRLDAALGWFRPRPQP